MRSFNIDNYTKHNIAYFSADQQWQFADIATRLWYFIAW